jgi:hypothetical protein
MVVYRILINPEVYVKYPICGMTKKSINMTNGLRGKEQYFTKGREVYYNRGSYQGE